MIFICNIFAVQNPILMAEPKKPTPAPAKQILNKEKKQLDFAFGKENYMWMLVGIAFIVIGFVLMSGGKTDDPNKFHPDEIFSARRIIIAPIVVLLGYAIEIFAILKKPKD